MNNLSHAGEFLGCFAVHEASGVGGIVVAELFYLHGCQQVQIQPKAKPDENTLPAAFWVDRTAVRIDLTVQRQLPRLENATGSYPLPPSNTPKGL